MDLRQNDTQKKAPRKEKVPCNDMEKIKTQHIYCSDWL